MFPLVSLLSSHDENFNLTWAVFNHHQWKAGCPDVIITDFNSSTKSQSVARGWSPTGGELRICSKWWQQPSGLVASFCNMLSLVIGGRHGAVHVDDVFSITQSVFQFHALITLRFGLFFFFIGLCSILSYCSSYRMPLEILLLPAYCNSHVFHLSLVNLPGVFSSMWSPLPLPVCYFACLWSTVRRGSCLWFTGSYFCWTFLDLSLNPYLDLFCLLDWLSLVVLVLAHLWVLLLINEILLCLQPLFLGPVPLIPGVSGTDNDIFMYYQCHNFFSSGVVGVLIGSLFISLVDRKLGKSKSSMSSHPDCESIHGIIIRNYFWHGLLYINSIWLNLDNTLLWKSVIPPHTPHLSCRWSSTEDKELSLLMQGDCVD